MKNLLLSATVTIFVASIVIPEAQAASKTYRGKWNGKFNSSFSITDAKKKRLYYCFRSHCGYHTFSGTTRKIRFRDRSGSWVFTKSGSGYRGRYVYKRNGSVSSISYR